MYLQEEESYPITGIAAVGYPVTDRVVTETSSKAETEFTIVDSTTEFTIADSTTEAMLKSITDVATDLAAIKIITNPTTADSLAITYPAKIASEATITHHPSHPMVTHSQSTEWAKAS
jgi:LytS/YehU family sensor histidine kinase